MLLCICSMDIIKISKVLTNKVRLDILNWLKDMEGNFPPQINVPNFDNGVCVCHIQEKTGLSQSTISHYLNTMLNADLVIATRIGKWTYYRRNESTIKDYITILQKKLIIL